MAKISVIIPIYNAEDYLEQCIKSVLDQSFKDIEIICVNDGSKDGSKQIIDSFAKKDKRIKVIHKENTGYGNSVNRGIDASNGEYIGIVESDDFITEDMYEELYELSEGGKADIVKGNFWDCYDEKDGSITYVENKERKDMPDVERFFNADEYPQFLWGHPSIWTAIYKRSFLSKNKIRFKEAKGGGWVDNPFFFETSYAAKKIKWTKTPYYCYRKTNDNSSSIGYDLKLPFERMEDNLAVTKKYKHMGEETLKVLYARAMMYTIGAIKEDYFGYQEDYARPFMQEMLGSLNADVFLDDFNVWDIKNFLKYRSPLLTVMPKVSKILIYNWLPFDNPQNAGGGVTVYCRNLIQSLLRYRPDVQVYFLSSGWAYDISKDKTYVRKTSNMFGDRCRTFEIVNSPVPAPQDMLFYNPEIAFKNKVLKSLFDEFLEKNGPFDNVHFNNIEGLSLDVLELKKKYKDTRFIYSMHNYVPICMTGFYYRRDKDAICKTEHSADDCDSCIKRNDGRAIRKQLIKRGIQKTTDDLYDEFEWLESLGVDSIDKISDEKKLYEFSVLAKNAINKNMDIVLAVSERVKKLAIENGITDYLIKTSYIGTKIASYQVRRSTARNSKYFKMAFLGTDINNKEKGYPFLLDSLSKLEKEYAAKTDLVLTTTTVDQDDYIKRKTKNFHSVDIIHGYNHAELSRILEGVHMGIIPVKWEDNLPQVAIEMVALGVPILCSEAGGASELCSSPKFRFRCGDTEDFLSKIKSFIKSKNSVKEYWKYHKGLVTLEEHFDEMSEVYELPDEAQATISVDDYSKIMEENEFLYKRFGEGLAPEEKKFFEMEEKVRLSDLALKQKDEVIKGLREEIEFLNYIIDETRKSMSYKIGIAATELPRKIREKIKG